MIRGPKDVPIEVLRQVFDYDPDTGAITRRSTGQLASTNAHGPGTNSVSVAGKNVAAKRLVWAMMTGRWVPSSRNYIRTRDGDEDNLKWGNLYSRDEFIKCSNCQEIKPVDQYYPNGETKNGLTKYLTICKLCHPIINAERRERDATLNHRMNISKYGLTEGDYAGMLEAQGGGCKICGSGSTAGRRLAVDHCHDTGEVRGLLCSRCNVGLGHFNDDPRLVLEAAKYLVDFRKRR